ncbi:ABC transporter permease [Aliirhizobium smilacinae]|uniref:ABC transporter permease n=2 Tax=Aliirhizobium smilacinae TaxID=1395944 RepID=A0A5C4XTF8_9HYPH|nr:ABC transporter permease [Rhizobium smilacinae]
MRFFVVSLPCGWLLAVMLASIGSSIVAPYAPNAIDLAARLQPPIGFGGNWSHILGTDNLGRDTLSRLLHAGQTSFLIAIIATLVGAAIGTTVGFLAAYFRGVVEEVIVALVDFQAAVPFFIVALAIIAAFGASTVTIAVLLCLFGWERYARVARAIAISVSERDYVNAAQLYGAHPLRIYLRHILPNTQAVLMVNLAVNFSEVILLESTLSFLGLGVQPPNASLGAMLNFGREYLSDAWWMAAAPGGVIFISILAVTALSEFLRRSEA